jgi:hypothetical protein
MQSAVRASRWQGAAAICHDMAVARRSTHEVFAAQFIERAQEIALRTQPGLVAGNNHCAIAINADANGFPHLLPRPI